MNNKECHNNNTTPDEKPMTKNKKRKNCKHHKK